jgi:hypothetical protein
MTAGSRSEDGEGSGTFIIAQSRLGDKLVDRFSWAVCREQELSRRLFLMGRRRWERTDGFWTTKNTKGTKAGDGERENEDGSRDRGFEERFAAGLTQRRQDAKEERNHR